MQSWHANNMNTENNKAIAEAFLRHLGGGQSDALVALFDENVDWNIPGDSEALPWIGQQRGRAAVAAFAEQHPRLIEQVAFDVQDILASEQRAIILVRMASRLKRNDALIEGEFAIVLTIAEGRITRFLMLEDSFAVSQACHAG